ncbi:MAG: LVIVD repeat-containing protein [Bacteroidota bacterium]
MEMIKSGTQKRISVSLFALLFLAALLGLSILLESCSDKCEVTSEYTYFAPVYTPLTEIRSSVKLGSPEPITEVGKIYFKDGYLFVNQPGKGIHIIDNRDASHPQVLSFLTIPGNYDLAAKGNTLYADSYIDLVALDIADITHIREIERLENVFSTYNTLGFYVDADKGLVTDWVEQKEVKVYESDCEASIMPWGGFYFEDGIAVLNGQAFNKSAALTPGTGSGPGVGGSMARFTINANYLYALDAGFIQSVDITSETQPVAKTRTSISWDMETIFPYGTNLFIGSRSGMHIIDVSKPETPVKISTYAHVTVCDPVVVEGDLAYVTLRTGNSCPRGVNELAVVDITDLKTPKLIKNYPMHNPHGLGIDESTLFICDGDEGLKVFDAKDVNQIDKNLLKHYKAIHAYDVIPFNNTLMMIGEDGLFQFDYTDPKEIKFLSKIALENAN